MSFCFLGSFFDFFLVTAITSVEGTFHSVFFFFFLRRRRLTACVVVIVICNVVTHSWNPSLFVACLNTSVLLPCFSYLVDRALTESGNCSDVWNVWYSSAHYTIESRRGTRTLIRQLGNAHSYRLFIPPNQVLEKDRTMRQILCCFLAQSRRWLRRHAKQSVQKFLTNAHFRLRRHVGRWSRSPGVPRMRLCSSLFAVKSTPTCNTSEDLIT